MKIRFNLIDQSFYEYFGFFRTIQENSKYSYYTVLLKLAPKLAIKSMSIFSVELCIYVIKNVLF